MDGEMQRFVDILKESRRIVFFGGAGVSTESGIPDFRSAQGLWNEKLKIEFTPEQLVSHTCFMKYPEQFFDFYREKLIYPDAKPNACHTALAELEKMGKLYAVVTQNIDGLHQMAGSKNVLELHGSIYRNYCIKCGRPYELDDILPEITKTTDTEEESKVDDGSIQNPDGSGVKKEPGVHFGTGRFEGVPVCGCGGIIKPDVVLYEESLDGSVLKESMALIANTPLLIVGGTSLNVYPAAGLLQYFKGSHLVLINKEPTPFDEKADLVIHGALGEVFSEL